VKYLIITACNYRVARQSIAESTSTLHDCIDDVYYWTRFDCKNVLGDNNNFLPRYMKCRRGLTMRILSVRPSICMFVCQTRAL